VGNVTINLRASDPGPPTLTPTAGFVSDGFHPNTVMQGIFGNVILQAFNSGYNANISLFSEQELLSHALIAYGGSDTVQSQIGAYTNFVVLPTLPHFTTINVASTNVTLQFSTVSNQLYILESVDDLNAASWTTVTNNVHGTSGTVVVSTALSTISQQGFYRVRQLP
jgi:hypothetical protein